MATRNQAAQKLADLILELVIQNDAIDSTTVESYRRVINNTTGTPTILDANGSNVQNILLQVFLHTLYFFHWRLTNSSYHSEEI